MNQIEQFRFDVLDKLRRDFDALGEAAILRDPGEGIPTHMLNVLHTEIGHSGEEVMGEYYFLPLEGENNKYHLFNIVLTFSEDMPEERYEILGDAANALNFFLPVGSIVFSKADSIMAYKYTSIIPGESSAEATLNIIDGSIGLALHIADLYLDELMKLMRGETILEDFLDILPGANR